MAATASLESLGATAQQDVAKAKETIAKTTEDTTAQLKTEGAKYDDQFSKIMQQFESLQKEGADAFKPFEAPKAQDPLKSYGASMAGLMGIVSFFTHSSMVPAMNAATASINAMREGNSDAFDKAFTEWKTNTELASKKLSWENEQLQTILQATHTNYNEKVAQITQLGALTKDAAVQAAVLSGDAIKNTTEIVNARIRGQEALAQHSAAVLELGQRQQEANLYKDWLKANPNATVEQKLDMLHQSTSKYGGSAALMSQQQKTALFTSMKAQKEKELGRPLKPDEELALYQKVNAKPSTMTGNHADQLRDRVDQFDQSLDKIDEAISVLDKNILAAGVTGRARRLGESVGNVLGSNQTDLVQFRRNIEYLQTMSHRLLTDATGRPLSADAKRLDDVIGGLSLGDTTANTKRALQEVADIYKRQRAGVLSRLDDSWKPDEDKGGSSAPAGGSGVKPASAGKTTSAMPWENDPQVGGH